MAMTKDEYLELKRRYDVSQTRDAKIATFLEDFLPYAESIIDERLRSAANSGCSLQKPMNIDINIYVWMDEQPFLTEALTELNARYSGFTIAASGEENSHHNDKFWELIIS